MSLGRGVFLAFVLVLCVAGFGAVAWKASASGGQSDDALPKGDASPKVVSKVTASAEDGIDAYDIRTDKSKSEDLLNFRQSAGKSASAIADVRDGFVTGEAALRERVPTLKVEYNDDIRIPEVIAPDLDRGNAFLTEASAAKHASILRGFVSENKELIGLENQQVG